MNIPWLRLTTLVVLLASVAACAPSVPGSPGSGETTRATGPKRITAAIAGRDPLNLRSTTGATLGGSEPGINVIEELIHAGITIRDDHNRLRPVLAEAVPSVENSLWRLSPDGQMETTWTIRSDASWQDGTPFTAQDLLFTVTVSLDPDMIVLGQHVGFSYLDRARAPDDRTITVSWKQPYIDADALFSTMFAMPLPRHLLEAPYRDNKRGFTDLPYWNHDFVGTGTFRISDWVDGSHMTLAANDQYVLGRPKLDEIVVKFIPDPNTMAATMLAGEVDVNLGRGLSLEQAVQVRDQWTGGHLEVGLPGNWLVAWPQFVDPRPPVLLDPQFRKALVHALDRQEMTEVIQRGLAPVAHGYIDTRLPEYRELDRFVEKYEYDPRKAIQMIEGTGYSRGSDGSFRDSTGQRLTLEIRDIATDDSVKAQLAMAGYWQRIGIGVESISIAPQRLRDREYRATRGGFEVTSNAAGVRGLRRAHSSLTALPANNYGTNGNEARYINPEFDALLDRLISTIPTAARMEILGQLLHLTSDQVTLIPLFYGVEPMVVNNRLAGIGPHTAPEGTNAWNAYEWDVSP